jgi:hypothetical protein
MSSELQAFRDALRAAGQPYSQWGARIVGFGLLFLVAAQVLAIRQQATSELSLGLVALSLLVMAVGWAMLIIAFVRRRRWAKAHPMEPPPMPPLS